MIVEIVRTALSQMDRMETPASQKYFLPSKHEPGPTRPRLHNESPSGHTTPAVESLCEWAASCSTSTALTPLCAARNNRQSSEHAER